MDLGKVMERQLTLDPISFNNALSKNAPKDAHIQLDEDHHRFMKLNKGREKRSLSGLEITLLFGKLFLLVLFRYLPSFSNRLSSHRSTNRKTICVRNQNESCLPDPL